MEDEHNSNRRNNGSADKIDAEQEIRQKPVVNFTYKRKSRNLGTEGEAERQATTQSREQNPQNDDVHRSQLTEENHEPMPEPATKKQKKQQTRKKGTKTTATKRVQFITNEEVNEDDKPESAKTGLSIIKTRSWTGLLRHRMAPSGFLTLIERLDYEQWSAVMDSGFGGMLSVRTKIIPKRMARWLLEHYDPWDNSLNLPNGKIQIDEEDVYATLGLPLGGQEITEGNISEADTEFVEMWRRRWNVPKRGPPIGSMDELILERGGHSNEFITDFITYAISTCIVGNAIGTCQSRVLKHLRNVEDIKNYNWCGYTVKCLNEAVVEWKKDKSKFFTGSLLFLMLLYLDRVQFRARKEERLFPTAINWDTNKVKIRDIEEQEAGDYGKGRIIQRIDYERIIQLAEEDLKMDAQELQEEQPQQAATQATSMIPTTKEQNFQCCPHCNGQLGAIVHDNDEPIQATISAAQTGQQQDKASKTDAQLSKPKSAEQPHQEGNVIDCSTPTDDDYCSPEFLQQVDKLESMAIEKMKRKTPMGCSPPSFNLGLSPQKGTPPTASAYIIPASVHTQIEDCQNPKSALTTTNTEQHLPQSNPNTAHMQITHENNKEVENPAAKKGNKKGKQVMVRQQPKRMVREIPFQCRSPYLRDYREARSQLTPEQLLLVDYAFLPPNNLHPSTEKLFEFVHDEEDKKLWLFREAFATLAGKDEDLENSVVDVLCLLLNWMERRRNPSVKKRMFFSTNIYLAIAFETSRLNEIFKNVMDLEVTRYSWMNLDETQMVFFPILRDNHFFIICFDFTTKKVIVLDNRSEKTTGVYKYSTMAMINMFANYLSNGGLKRGFNVRQFVPVFWALRWQDNSNIHDCGIYAIRHMETFQGGHAKSWTPGFEKNKEQFVKHLRSRYAAMILQSELNKMRMEVQEAAKKEYQERQTEYPSTQQ